MLEALFGWLKPKKHKNAIDVKVKAVYPKEKKVRETRYYVRVRECTKYLKEQEAAKQARIAAYREKIELANLTSKWHRKANTAA